MRWASPGAARLLSSLRAVNRSAAGAWSSAPRRDGNADGAGTPQRALEDGNSCSLRERGVCPQVSRRHLRRRFPARPRARRGSLPSRAMAVAARLLPPTGATPRSLRLPADEIQQRLVEGLRMRRVQAVRSTFDEHELAPLDRFVRALSARFERDDRVGVAVDDQRRDGDLLQVGAEIRAAERGDAVQRSFGRGKRSDVARVDPLLLADLQLAACAEEAPGEVVDERDPIALHPVLELRDGRLVERAFGIVLRLVKVWRHSGSQHGLRDAAGPVLGDVAYDLTAAHREADKGRLLHVEVAHQRVEIGGKSAVVVSVPRLRRRPEPPTVVSDHTVPGTDERRHLVLPRPTAQRPAVNEHDGFSRTVILVMEFDRSAILGTHLQPGHRGPPFGWNFSVTVLMSRVIERSAKIELFDRGARAERAS